MRWLNSFPFLFLSLTVTILTGPALVLANTEIANFAAAERTDAPVLRGQTWPVLRPHTSTHWTLARAPLGTPLASVCAIPNANSTLGQDNTPCPYELWLALDLPEDAENVYERWTLRLSWPASTPTQFTLDILDPRAAAALFLVPPQIGAPTTRRKYARVRAVDEGVRTPGGGWRPSLAGIVRALNTTLRGGGEVENAEVEKEEEEEEKVEFILTLEPLLLGVLPASLRPFLLVAGAVLVLLAMPGGGLYYVQRGVEGLVGEARREIEDKERKEE
ncbi:hypothetical protein B0H19DRAFT_1175173 [Mycena capillaripes]|nr:hypothetical protein B0H19DRAFT_1175173 [Mycena capillaripes]